MKLRNSLVTLSLCASAVLPNVASAAVTAEEAARLGKDLTPIGAIRAANAEGTIPEWTPGEQTELKAEYPSDAVTQGQKSIFSISAANVAEYNDKLTAGHIELLRRFPDSYKLNVYPSVRRTNFPQKIFDETIKNATRAHLDDPDSPRGAYVGFPFPIPKTGAEPIWNHRVKWRGNEVIRNNDQMIVQQDGSFQVTQIVEDVQFYYSNIDKKNPAELKPGTDFLRYLSETISPPRIAGTFILVHEKAGTGPEGRSAWLYAPALKRIRRAPAVCCDNPYEGTDGHQFYDQVDLYNGVLERFTWKLIGRREMYIPSNSYKIGSPPTKYADIARPNHINQDLARYELRRVWVVEANNKPDNRHTFSKRTIYLDEDSWNIVAIDNYDHENKLMQFQEGHLMNNFNVLATTTQPEIIYHLDSGRYFGTSMINEGKPNDPTVSFGNRHFEANTIQKKASK